MLEDIRQRRQQESYSTHACSSTLPQTPWLLSPATEAGLFESIDLGCSPYCLVNLLMIKIIIMSALMTSLLMSVFP